MKILKKICALVLCLMVVFSCITASAAVYTKKTTHYYSCNAHSNCSYVTFASQGDTSTGKIYDKYFSANHAHWPNAFRYDNVWSYQIGTTGYAKGTYTLYSSLITQWASIAFASTSRTITHTY